MTYYNLIHNSSCYVRADQQLECSIAEGKPLVGHHNPQKNHALHPRRQKATNKAILSKKKTAEVLFNLPRSRMEIQKFPTEFSSVSHPIESPLKTQRKKQEKLSLASSIRPHTFLRSEVVMIYVIFFLGIHLEPKTSFYKWLFQSDDSYHCIKKWIKITKHPFKTGSFRVCPWFSWFFFHPPAHIPLALGSLALLDHLRLRPHRCVWRSRAPSFQTKSWSWSCK